MNGQNYRFLEIFRESEATHRGINLTEKAVHFYYKTIKARSTPSSIKAAETFHYFSAPDDSTETTEEFRHESLAFLQKEQLVVMLPFLRYNPSTSLLEMEPVFIGMRDEGEAEIQDVYQAIIRFSVESIRMYTSSKSNSSSERILSDLDYDYRSSELPGPGELNYTVLTPFSEVRPDNFPFTPAGGVIESFIKDCKIDLLENRILTEVPAFRGYLSLMEEESLLRFDTSSTFLVDHVIPRYENQPDLRKKFKDVELKETEAQLEDFPEKTPAYAIQRSMILRDHFRQVHSGEERWFPGRLAVDSILKLDGLIQEFYQKRERTKREAQKEKLIEEIISHTSGFLPYARFYTENEKGKIHPEVWDSLQSDHRLLHSRWETRNGTMHLLIDSRMDSIKNLIKKLTSHGPSESWKILSIHHALEENPELFEQLKVSYDFRANLNAVLQKTSVPYMPWIYRILFKIGIPLFLQSGQKIARKRILQEQDSLMEENRRRARLRKEQEKKAREEKRNAVDRMGLMNQITGVLDVYYFERNVIPTIADLIKEVSEGELSESPPSAVRQAITRGGFQLITVNESDPVDLRLVLHPLDHEWKIKEVHIYRSLEKIFQSTADKGILKNARAVQKRMTDIQKSPPEQDPASPDAYQRLEKAIKKKFQ